jgi:hypothetical protein
MTNRFSKTLYFGLLSVSVAALLSLGVKVTDRYPATSMVGAAQAEGHDSGGGGKKGGGDDHSHEDGDSDDHSHEDGDSDDHDHEDGGSGKGPNAGGEGSHGEGSHGEDSDQGKGQGAGQSGSAGKDGAGKRPVWAKEGLPEVELGRLNVARSPSRVLDRAYVEALAGFNDTVAAFYSLPLSDALTALRTDFANISFIDSPLQNLALLRDALDGTSSLTTEAGVTNSNATLMSLFLGTASDKTIPISPETAYSVAAMLGFELSQAAATSLATDAEAVRQALLEGHG